MRKGYINGLAAALCSLLVLTACCQPRQISNRAVVRDCMRQVVRIRKFSVVGGEIQEASSGSAVTISRAGYFVTAYHCVVDEQFVRMEINLGGEWVTATVIAGDQYHDIALLHAAPGNARLYVATIQDDEPAPGDRVYVAGYPYPYQLRDEVISSGIVSNSHATTMEGGCEFIQTDATLNSGESGGGTFDDQGRLVAINSGMFSYNDGASCGLSYVVPITWLLPMMHKAHVSR